MKILLAGDLVVNQPYQCKNISQSVIDLFESVDYRIVNLEAPVTDSKEKITKVGPHLRAHEKSTADVLKQLDVNCVTLANNHIRDLGDQGVMDTIEFCKKMDISTVGAGANLADASRTMYIETKHGKIALVNIAENEWCNATEWSGGANPMDLIDNAKQIQNAKKEADWVFVIIHGGHEYYNLPSPRMQKQYRYYAEQGADLVVAHHTHCINGFEVYNEVPIYYSLGNFLFTKESVHEDWYQGLVLEIEIKKDELLHKLHVVEQSKKDYSLTLSKDERLEEAEKRIAEYHQTIINKQSLQLAWKSYVIDKTPSFLTVWSGLNHIPFRYLRGGLRRLGFGFRTKFGLERNLNFMRCEAHRDLSYAILRKELNVPDPDFTKDDL